MSRIFPVVQVRRYSPNRYEGRGENPALIVIHATAGHNRPGVVDLESLAAWFASSASQVSSHVATDNEGHSARFVLDSDTAWHVCAFNRLSLGIEQVIPGTGAEVTEDLYNETARWVALFSRRHGIPIQAGEVSGIRVTRPGVVRHSDLGALGCSHSDPGPYDMGHLLRRSHSYKRAQDRWMRAHSKR